MALGEIAGSLAEAREVVRRVVREPDATSRPGPRSGARRASGSPTAHRRRGCRREVAQACCEGIPAPEDRWDDAAAEGLGLLEGLVYRSNLLGADRALANLGGGNTSAKGMVVDHTGREDRASLWVKGSGTDLATITPGGIRRACGSTSVLPLRERERMDDATMVDYLRALRRYGPTSRGRRSRRCCTRFVPAPHVDHTHPDAVIALTSSPDGRRLAEEEFGDEAVWLDYQRPGFDMSRRIAELLDGGQPGCARGAARKARARDLGRNRRGELPRRRSSSSRARPQAIDRAAARRVRPGRPESRASVATRARTELLARSLPALRGALLEDADGVILEVDRSPEAVAFASSARAPEVSQIGAPCPDHLINTKHKPLVVDFDPARDGADELARRFPARRRRSTRPGTATTTSGTSTTRAGRSRSTRPGRASCSCPGVGHRHERRRRGQGAVRARPLPPRHRGRGRGRRDRRVPLAQRGGGVRDRVLAARALQARPGAAARRARRPGRGRHRRRERHRPRRPRALLAERGGPRRRRRPQRSTAPHEVAEAIVAAHGAPPRRSPCRST